MDVSRTKDEIAQRRDGPAVNVKVYRPMTAGIVRETGDDGFTMDWIEANMTEDDLNAWWWIACESAWDDLQSDVEHVFGEHVKVWSDGRSGGWAVVTGLPDVDTWDAIALGRWQRWEQYALSIADAHPEIMADLIYCNVYDAAMTDRAEDVALALKTSRWQRAKE